MNAKARYAVRWLILTPILALAIVPFISAQDPQTPPLSAPPPLKIISKSERALIEAERDSKDRLKLTIQLAATHLGLAEKYTAQSSFEAASAEIGFYHALIEDALTFLSLMKRDSNRTRDLYKKLELALRADGPRLTAMRRVTPLEFAVWVKKAEDFAREGRTEALNSFYGHTVVREKPAGENPNPKPSPTPKTQQP
jgi:hypothetical protein